MSKHTDKGVIAELLGITWLVDKGYWVFQNMAPQGPIDVIAVHQKTGKILLLDMKTLSRDKSRGNCIRSRILSTKARELGVQLMYVDVENQTCRIVKRRDDWEKEQAKKRGKTGRYACAEPWIDVIEKSTD